jgi:hypothetical protein
LAEGQLARVLAKLGLLGRHASIASVYRCGFLLDLATMLEDVLVRA